MFLDKCGKHLYLMMLILIQLSFLPYKQILPQVLVQLQQPPPYQFKVEHMWKITLLNQSSQTYQVYLFGTASEVKSGLIVEATTAKLSLKPGIKIITPRDLGSIKVTERNSKFSDVIKNIGGVPSGDYEICVKVISAETDFVLGSQCINQTVMNLTQVELLIPRNNSLILNNIPTEYIQRREYPGNVRDLKQPLYKSIKSNSGGENLADSNLEPAQISPGGFIMFTWLPPSPVPVSQIVKYTIRLVEIMGWQSGYDAMKSNPAIYEQKNIYSTIFQYPIAARSLQPGKRYAWIVSAYLNNHLISESEVWEFSFGMEQDKSVKVINTVEGEDYSGLSQVTKKVTSHNIDFSSNFNKRNLMISSDDFESIMIFSGKTKLEMESANRKATNSEVPKNYSNLELNPMLTIFDVPFTSNILLSSQNEKTRQNINSFALNFDLSTLQNSLKERVSKKIDESNILRDNELSELKSQLEVRQSLQTRMGELSLLDLDSLNDEQKAEIDSIRSKLSVLSDLEEKISQLEKVGEIDREIENLDDPTNLEANLEKYDLISGQESFFMMFKSLGIGTNYPTYTPHTLSGVPVSGLNIEFEPAFLYVAYSGSLNQKPIDNKDFKRNLYAGRFGFGTKEGSHLHLTGMYVRDDENSIKVDSANLSLTPKANHLFGAETKMVLFDDLTLEAEIVGSVLTRDVRDPALESAKLPKDLKDIVKPKLSTSFDYMYTGKASYANSESDTKISLGFKMIGPGFTSLGVPNLRSDNMGFEGKFDQKFADRKISLSTFYKSQRDNLIDWKSSTTKISALGINLSFSFPEFPYLALIYSPYFQKNNQSDSTMKIDNSTNIFSLIMSYSYPISDLQSSTSFSFSLYDTKTFKGISDMNSKTFSITEAVSFEFPLSISGSFTLITSKMLSAESNITTIDLNASYLSFYVWQNTFGLSFAKEKNMNRKIGFYLSSSVVLWDILNLDVGIEQASYKDLTGLTESSLNDYNDLIIKSTFQIAW